MTHRWTRRRWLAIVALLATPAALGLAACDDDDAGLDTPATESEVDEASPDTDNGAGGDAADDSGQPSDGNDSAEAGADDFPIPAPDGLVLDALADAGITMSAQRQLYYEDDDYDRVVAFYEDWTSQNGEWATGQAEGVITFQSLDTDVIRSIAITPDHDPGAQADGLVTFVLLVADG